MNTDTTQEIDSTSSKNTYDIAFLIGKRVKGGEIIELRSDVGGGKTVFASGFVAGVGSKDLVTSPSFAIKNHYRADALDIEHFDFYRLQDAGVMARELQEDIADNQKVVLVEWATVVEDVLPEDRLVILIAQKEDENQRSIVITAGQNHTHLLEAST